MVITFWAGTYKTKEELQILIDAVDTSVYELLKRADCWDKDSCRDCVAKPACKDMYRFLDHLQTVAEDL